MNTKIYLAAAGDEFRKPGEIENPGILNRSEFYHNRILLSFYDKLNSKKSYYYRMAKKRHKVVRTHIFIDSGAFSAFTLGKEILLDKYISFLHSIIQDPLLSIDVYANMDKIGDSRSTWENQMEMERNGLSPLPCFHYGEDEYWLRKYVDKYSYIALGGMVPLSTSPKQLYNWVYEIFKKYIMDNSSRHGYKIRVHGFGMTNLTLMNLFPWYSVDSGAWFQLSRQGSLMIPKIYPDGKIDYLNKKTVSVSHMPFRANGERSNNVSNNHLKTMTPLVQRSVYNYTNMLGVPEGRTRYRILKIDGMEPKHVPLRHNQKIVGHNKKKKFVIIQTITQEGFANRYQIRDFILSHYFHSLEKQLPLPRRNSKITGSNPFLF